MGAPLYSHSIPLWKKRVIHKIVKYGRVVSQNGAEETLHMGHLLACLWWWEFGKGHSGRLTSFSGQR